MVVSGLACPMGRTSVCAVVLMWLSPRQVLCHGGRTRGAAKRNGGPTASRDPRVECGSGGRLYFGTCRDIGGQRADRGAALRGRAAGRYAAGMQGVLEAVAEACRGVEELQAALVFGSVLERDNPGDLDIA